MKNKKIGFVLLGIWAVVLVVSCASAPPAPPAQPPATTVQETPPPPSPPPGPPPVDQATLAALEAAAARAEAARKQISDFGGPFFFPEECEDANSLYSQAEQQRRSSTREEAQQSAERYIRAAEAYEALLKGSIARSYESMANELNAARNAAINVGANDLVPEMLLEVDAILDNAEEKYGADDYYAAKAAAENALAMYKGLRDGVTAYNIREEIAAGVNELVPEVLSQVDEIGLAAIEKWNAGDYNDAVAEAGAALTMYSALRSALEAYNLREEYAEMAEEIVPDALWRADIVGLDAIGRWEEGDFVGAKASADTALAMYSGVAASAERQRALDLRADTAARLEFNVAQDFYARANAALSNTRYQEAALQYGQSRYLFKVVADIAMQRRLTAEDALRRANQRLAESDAVARNAELMFVGGVE